MDWLCSFRQSEQYPQGAIDEIAIYRQALPAEAFAQRYSFIRNEPAFDPSTIPADKILVQIWEESRKIRFSIAVRGMTGSYEVDAFEFFQITINIMNVP